MNPRFLSYKALQLLSNCHSQLEGNIFRKKLSKLGLRYLTVCPSILSRVNSPHHVNIESHRAFQKSSLSSKQEKIQMEAVSDIPIDSSTELDSLSIENKYTSVLNVKEDEGWLDIGEYRVFAWSISGVESCIVVKSDDVQIAFDMGIAHKESVKVPNVFITHGHIDHIGGVSNHMAKRSLKNMRSAKYFVPPHLVEPLRSVVQAHQVMSEQEPSNADSNIFPITEGETVELNSSFFVKTFPTIHRVPSQGYIVYKKVKKLKEEYRGLEGFLIAALYREGREIHDEIITPEIAYTGDTTVDIFTNPPNEDLLKVKLLITEATFLEERDKKGQNIVSKAKDRGHTHLIELAECADVFKKVGHILLVHFSNQYNHKTIKEAVRDRLPTHLRCKVSPATVATCTKPSTYL